jgi:predicted RND superfamily exporter protein
MTNKIKTLIAAFSILLIFCIGAAAQAKPDCTKVTEKEIVKAVYDKIMTKYSSQISHINVRVKDNVVTIEGWVTTKSVKKEIEKWAKKVSCVKKVVNILGVGAGAGCGPGMKQCGDICIPEKEACSLCRGVPCF